MNEDKDLSIYIHWPFCRSKCPYCDFFSRVKKDTNEDALIKDYIEQLQKYKELLPDKHIISIFFGGGTPSLIKPQNISLLIQEIDKLWGIGNKTEISLEANPNTSTPTLFADLSHAGINRLSLGVQSFDDKELKFLGRTHSSAEAMKSIEEVLKNFSNHSIDLMYALPNQEKPVWQKNLEIATSFGLKHISLYQLTIEENTVFYRKGVKPLNENIAAEFYNFTEDFLSLYGFDKYEVSNYAQKGFASIHNQTYWLGKDYIGIGQGAHGRFRKDGKFYASTDKLNFEELTPQERAEELIIMGLRLTRGINKKSFKNNCLLNFDNFINQEFKKQMLEQKLIAEDKETLRATKQGFLVLNYLIEGLCPAL